MARHFAFRHLFFGCNCGAWQMVGRLSIFVSFNYGFRTNVMKSAYPFYRNDDTKNKMLSLIFFSFCFSNEYSECIGYEVHIYLLPIGLKSGKRSFAFDSIIHSYIQ